MVSKVSVRGVDYDFFYRDLRGVIATLLERVGRQMDVPKLHNGAENGWSEIWHGTAYQALLQKFLDSGGDLHRDLLVPLVFFSGFLFSFPCIHVHYI